MLPAMIAAMPCAATLMLPRLMLLIDYASADALRCFRCCHYYYAIAMPRFRHYASHFMPADAAAADTLMPADAPLPYATLMLRHTLRHIIYDAAD